MKRLLLVLAIAAAVIGVALSLFGVMTVIALACAEGAGSCGFVSLLIGIPLLTLGVSTIVEFWPGHKD